MTDFISAMRARVRLERPTRTPDAMGGAALGWANEGDVWAEVAALSASESAAFDATPMRASLTLTIRRRDDVRAGWRVIWGARVLRIVGVRDAGEPRIDLICEEEIL